MAARRRSAWAVQPAPLRDALNAAWSCGVPIESSALYARWWQLETWLRSLLHVEESALRGHAWSSRLSPLARRRSQAEQAMDYMLTPDAHSEPAYLDVSELFGLLLEDWEQFGPFLIDRAAWEGRATELMRIRHRIGHCRRPHADDLGRLEQTLRDLEVGAIRATSAFNDVDAPNWDADDPLVAQWVHREHATAARLIDHAARQYDTTFNLYFSRRPWAEPLPASAPISGSRGHLWHARFSVRGGRGVSVHEVWNDSYLDPHRGLIVFLTANSPYHLEFTFAALDDPAKVGDAIGNIFDAVLTNPMGLAESSAYNDVDRPQRWLRMQRESDARLQVATPWSTIEPGMPPVTLFGA